MSKDLEYYLELLGQEKEKASFNLWAETGGRFYNLATLFYKDPICGTQWSVDETERAVSHDKQGINDELENPLRKIQQMRGKELLSMKDKSPEEVAEYIKNLRKKSQAEGIEYLFENYGEAEQ